MSSIPDLIEKGNFEEAFRVANDVLEKDPYNIEVLVQKAVIQRKRKQFEDALELLDKVLNLLPKNADIYSEKGVTLFHVGKLNEALDCLNIAQELEPNNPYRYSSRAYIKDALRDVDGAIEDYEKALELDPTDIVAQNNLGLLEEKKGNLNKAKKHYNQVDDSCGINYDEIVENVKEEDHKRMEESKKEVIHETSTSSIWQIILSVFTTKRGFKEFISFIKNGFK